MLYLLIPFYNEEGNVERVIHAIRSQLRGSPYRIVAVNDGSVDGTQKRLESIQSQDLLIVSYQLNMGIGSAFMTGIHEVLKSAKSSDILVILEGDQTSTLDTLKKMVSIIHSGRADIVIASRYKKGGSFVRFPLIRLLMSKMASALMRSLFPIEGVNDYTIFYRVYRIGLIKKATGLYGEYGLIQSRGFVANVELLVKLSFLSKRIVEIPFIYDFGRREGKSKIAAVKTIVEYFRAAEYLRSIRNKLDVLMQ